MAENSKIQWTDMTFNPWRGCTKISAGCANCYAETMSGRNPGVLGVWGPNGTRVVAAEAQWKEPLKWEKRAQTAFIAARMAGEPAPERPRVFCASLADVFEDWPYTMVDSQGRTLNTDWTPQLHGDAALMMRHVRERLFRLIDATPNLDWLILTKRPENLKGMLPTIWQTDRMPNNLWLGTSVENQEQAEKRIPELLKVPAAVRFLSCEPLLGPVDLEKWLYRYKSKVSGLRYKTPGAAGDHDVLPGIDWVIVGGES